jgi:hypothetical protein
MAESGRESKNEELQSSDDISTDTTRFGHQSTQLYDDSSRREQTTELSSEIIRLMKEEEMMETEAYRIVADTIIYKGDIPREPMDITNWNFGDEEEDDY